MFSLYRSPNSRSLDFARDDNLKKGKKLRRFRTEAIRIYWESTRPDRSPASMLREIEVELPA